MECLGSMYENNALNKGIEFRHVYSKEKRGNTPHAVETEKTTTPLLVGSMGRALRSTQF